MGTLILFNLILIAITVALLLAAKRWVRSERARFVLFLVAPLVTIVFHYSSLLYHLLFTGEAVAYLASTPNLFLPIYPCNVVMWCALLYGLLPNKSSKAALLFSDYIFWFGIVSTLVGMFANVDFIVNPTLTDFEVTKSIVAHATLLFNVLLIPVFGTALSGLLLGESVFKTETLLALLLIAAGIVLVNVTIKAKGEKHD